MPNTFAPFTEKAIKKIMIVLPNDNLGGAEQYLKMIAEFFLNNGYYVDVFFLKKKISGAWNELEGERLRLVFTKMQREKVGLLSLFFKLLRNSRNKYEFVFTSHIHVNSFTALLRRIGIISSKYHVARESTSIFKRYKGWKLAIFKAHYKLNYHNIDLLVCQTDYMLNQLREGLPSLFDKINIKVIPNPINLVSLIQPSKSKQHIFSNYIVSAGRLISEKGFDLLIEAFATLSKRFPGLNLVILGEGEMRSALQTKIEHLGLTDKVHLPGFVKNVYPYFAGAKACVVSSRIEGFPNVLLQMMSQNNTVVSTLCAGGIDDLQGVITCKTADETALLDAMEIALNKDTSGNRALFDAELKERSVNIFVRKVKRYLND